MTRLTHFGHSCLLFEVDGTRVLIDPGSLASGWESLTGLTAVLVTHQHPDHLDVKRFPQLLAGNPLATYHCDTQTAQRECGPWQPLQPGDELALRDARVSVQGGTHAVIHPDIPTVANVALLLGTAQNPAQVLHPGDSLHVPDRPVEVLAVPVAAPWLKVSEAVDYVRAVAPRTAVPIHQGMLATTATVDMIMSGLAPESTKYYPLAAEEPLVLS